MADDKNGWGEGQGDKNNNPEQQPKDVAAMQKTDPRANSNNDKAVAHQAIGTADDKKESGVDIGLVNAPVQSLNPTSAQQGAGNNDPDDEPEYEIFDNIKRPGQEDFKYPFDELEAGQAMFIPVEKGDTTDKLKARIQKMVHQFREAGAEIETDENGDQVRESVVIETRKRTSDGLIQLDGSGKPIVGANQTNRYKMIYSSNFTVTTVVKGDEISEGNEAESDGVLVNRLF